MPKNQDSVNLIVGADGLVGDALLTHLQCSGKPVLGTSRRRPSADKSYLFLDLGGDLSNWSCPKPVSVAYLCAGITKISDCEQDPNKSAWVNIEGISTISEILVASGARVVYLSTSAVFDGSTANRSQFDLVCPTTEYGRQKAEAEKRISALGDRASIVRFSKIIGPETQLFQSWTKSLSDGDEIHPYSDMVMSPLPVSIAVNVLLKIGDAHQGGIFQMSGDRDVTYSEAALASARAFGADNALIQPVETPKEDRQTDSPIRHTTLDGSRINSELGIERPNVPKVLDDYFRKMAKVAQ